MIFIPLFLARGHPERLQINDSVTKVCVCVREREVEVEAAEGKTLKICVTEKRHRDTSMHVLQQNVCVRAYLLCEA